MARIRSQALRLWLKKVPFHGENPARIGYAGRSRFCRCGWRLPAPPVHPVRQTATPPPTCRSPRITSHDAFPRAYLAARRCLCVSPSLSDIARTYLRRPPPAGHACGRAAPTWRPPRRSRGAPGAA
ncbi:hypothetical protein ACU4GD_28405 [Cupriavidus basilensis]